MQSLKMTSAMTLTFVLALIGCAHATSQITQYPESPPISIKDVFLRPVDGRSIVLLDWDGQIANPAPRYFVESLLEVPCQVTLSIDVPKVYLELPSVINENGSVKVLRLSAGSRVGFRLGALPDRDGQSEVLYLSISCSWGSHGIYKTKIPLLLEDQDIPEALLEDMELFKVNVEYLARPEERMFENHAAREPVAMAAKDWAYFLKPNQFQGVEIGDETTWIWEGQNFESGNLCINNKRYDGVMLYVYEHRNSKMIASGHSTIYSGLQIRDDAKIGLRRSCAVTFDPRGNYSDLGWMLEGEGRWWERACYQGDAHDLYSIALHEIGHAVAFNESHPRFHQLVAGEIRCVGEERQYFLRDIAFDDMEHFRNWIDPISGIGAFGRHYSGHFPVGRWMITKSDLMILKLLGYQMRNLEILSSLQFRYENCEGFNIGDPVRISPIVSGAIPPYEFRCAEGSFPPNLSLDRFTGVITGKAESGQSGRIRIELLDSSFPSPRRSEALVSLAVR